MTLLKTLALAATLALSALPAAAEDGVQITGAFAQSSGIAIGIYFEVENQQDEDDTLLSAFSPVAQKTAIHHSGENAEGVMSMTETTLVIPSLGVIALQPGKDHVMLMGLIGDPAEGDMIPLTLTFERAGDVTLEVPLGAATAGHDAHAAHGSAAP